MVFIKNKYLVNQRKGLIVKYKCWCCSNTVDIENDLCYDCENGICETEQKLLNGDDIYV